MSAVQTEEKKPRKRGRKPKGGKIVESNIQSKIPVQIKQNVVLHLKCHSSDIEKQTFLSDMVYTPDIAQVQAFDCMKTNFEVIDNKKTQVVTGSDLNMNMSNVNINDATDNIIWENLRKLKKQFMMNDNINDKRSVCFWCTCEFNTHPIYIPKCKIKNMYEVYGYFCSPECAVAYLYKEHIDTSTRWERYALLYALYSSIFGYKTKIRPSPDPHYLLNKFFGNMTIEEYRKLSKMNTSIMILNKPITRIVPEISDTCEDVDIHARFKNMGDMTTGSQYRLSRSMNSSKLNENFPNKQYWKDIKK